MNIKDFRHNDWIVYFSGDKWSPLGFSSWVTLFTHRPFAPGLNSFGTQTIMVWDGETTTCYVRESERERFGSKVVNKVLKNKNYINEICNGLKSGTDYVLSKYGKKNNIFSFEEYKEYNTEFLQEYYPFHVQVKNVVDFLPNRLLKKYLPLLEKVRKYAEPVFSREVRFMNRIASFISKKSGYEKKLILQCQVDELNKYWRNTKKLPSKKILQARYYRVRTIVCTWSGNQDINGKRYCYIFRLFF